MPVALSFTNSSLALSLLRAESVYSFSCTYFISFGEIVDPIKKDFKAHTKRRSNKDQSMADKKGSFTLNYLNSKIPLLDPFHSKSNSS
jgi:hypothetical protein